MIDLCNETPLVESLQNVPVSHRTEWEIQWADDGTPTGHAISPIGHLCHKAADRIEELEAENARLRLAAQQPTARRSDPETSHEAAQDAKFNSTMNQINVLLELHKFGPLTDFQLERRTGINQNSIGKRRLDCQRAGLVEAHIMDGEKVKRKSRPGSKSKAQVWRLTEAGAAFIEQWKREQKG